MAHDYIPKRDADFRDWSASLSEQINVNPEQFGLTPLLASQYAVLNDAYAAALAAAADRARPAIEAKKTARAAAEKQARVLVHIIQAHPQTTNAMRAALGITVRDAEPTRAARPVDRPSLYARLLYGSTVRIRLRDPESAPRKRGKPDGIIGATIYSFIGDEPPHSLAEWTDEGNTGRTDVRITLHHGIVPGSKVWFTASWYNPRGQRGPAAEPKSVHVACPTLMLRDAEQRMAA